MYLLLCNVFLFSIQEKDVNLFYFLNIYVSVVCTLYQVEQALMFVRSHTLLYLRVHVKYFILRSLSKRNRLHIHRNILFTKILSLLLSPVSKLSLYDVYQRYAFGLKHLTASVLPSFQLFSFIFETGCEVN